MKINVEAIKQRLFTDPVVCARIIRDFDIANPPSDADALGSVLISLFDQEPLSRPLEQPFPAVFRAAVRALGSNSRAWATFLKSEHKLKEHLRDYNPTLTYLAFQQGQISLEEIKACLPGQSSSGDARAIKQWAQLLTEVENYYEYIQDVGHAFQQLNQVRFKESLDNTDLLLCLVGYLAYPPSTWAGSHYLSERSRRLSYNQRKLPGMGYVLASEFLRNLGWNGFKPDRHVQRLFDRWFSNRITVQIDIERFQLLIGCKANELNTYLKYSLIGIVASPPDMPLSQVDNFVWLLGSYVEKKGKESSRSYLLDV